MSKEYAAIVVDKTTGLVETIKFLNESYMLQWIREDSPRYSHYEIIKYVTLKVKRDVVVTITGDCDDDDDA